MKMAESAMEAAEKIGNQRKIRSLRWYSQTFLSLILLCLLFSCEARDICRDLFGYKVQEECVFAKKKVTWDSILIVGPYMYPEEVESYTSIKYDFPLQTDPNIIFIYMQDGRIKKRKCGTCRINIGSGFDTPGATGIIVIRRNDCIVVGKNKYGRLVLHRK